MNRIRAYVVLLVFSCVLSAQTVIRVGAVTAIPGLFEPIRERLEKELNIKLVLSEASGVDMLADVQAGKLDVAVAGITMAGWLQAMKATHHPAKPIEEYRHLVIGTDRLSVLINPDVVTGVEVLAMDLDKAQIKGLFTGRIRNWKELGGPDLPVVVLVSRIFVTTAKVFIDQALDGEAITKDFKVIPGGIYDIPKALVATPGSISFGPLGLTTSTKIWSPAQAPKLERPFTMVISDQLDPAMKKAVASMVQFIQGPGQKLINQ
jgi:phosphate transport system substrate-binding protein